MGNSVTLIVDIPSGEYLSAGFFNGIYSPFDITYNKKSI